MKTPVGVEKSLRVKTMSNEMIVALAMMAAGLFAIKFIISKAGDGASFLNKMLALPGTAILRAVVMIATLPAAIVTVNAEKDLAGFIGKEVDAAQIEKLRLKMAKSAKTAWFNAQVHGAAANDSFHVARRFA